MSAIFIIILILGGLITASGIIIKIMSAKIKRMKHEIAQKDFAIQKAAQNIKILTDHSRAIKEIRKNKSEIITRIEKVQEGDDEEINNILRDIVNANNERV